MRDFKKRLARLEARVDALEPPKLIICEVGETPEQAARRVFGDAAERVLAAKRPHPSGMPHPPNLFVVPVCATPRRDDE